MNILVTGGCGFIGSHIVDVLIEDGHNVIVVDNLSTGSIKNLNNKAVFYNIDILSDSLKEVFEKERPEVVYHHAAQINIQYSIQSPSIDANVNIVGTIKVLECMREYNINKIIYASSAAAYGDPKYLPIDEEHEKNPLSFYGISKYTPEYYIDVFSKLYGIKYTILRYANVYGIRQDPKGEGGVVSIFTDMVKEDKSPFIFGTGEQIRDFIYVKDIALANLCVLNKGDNQVFNVSTCLPTSVNELLKEINNIYGKNIKPIYEDARNGDIFKSILLNHKLIKETGWEPKYDLKQGLKETIDYYNK